VVRVRRGIDRVNGVLVATTVTARRKRRSELFAGASRNIVLHRCELLGQKSQKAPV